MPNKLGSKATSIVIHLSPWLSPIPTAYLIWRATQVHLAWPVPVAMIAAVIIECLGFASAATALELREYNASKRKSDPSAPFGLAAFLVLAYTVVAIGLTVVLDIYPEFAPYSPAIFPLLSLAGVTIIALQSDHVRRLESIESVKQERKARRSGKRSQSGHLTGQDNSQATNADQEKADNLTKANAVRRSKRDVALDNLVQFYSITPHASYSEAARSVDRSKSWVTGAVSDLVDAGRLIKNGQGVEAV